MLFISLDGLIKVLTYGKFYIILQDLMLLSSFYDENAKDL